MWEAIQQGNSWLQVASGERVTAEAHGGDEEGSLADLAGLAVVNGDSGAGVVDEELLARSMLLAEGKFVGAVPLAVQIAEAAITVAAGLGLFVLPPDQLQGKVFMLFQFLVDGVEVGRGVNAAAGWCGALTEQEFV
jgi:hypothetical protein